MPETRVHQSSTGSCLLLALLLCMPACSIVPERQVLPYPDHIRAGLEAGDRVEILTRGLASPRNITISEIGANHIVTTQGERIAFVEITSINMRSWSLIANPCDDGVPKGCSIPPLVAAASDYYSEYGREFRESCVSHDYCYRHGMRTYGYTKTDCDNDFLEDMQQYCAQEHDFNIMARGDCLLAADQLHAAVDRFGDDHFLTQGSTYCEYAGPPLLVPNRK